MAMDRRATGWLTELHHARARELLCLALARHDLVCPTYCVMPDHAHFLWVGFSEASDQRLAVASLRKSWNDELRPTGHRLQKQCFDHVLRDQDRERDAFSAVARYVCENPVHAKIAHDWKEYPFSGALVPGYPTLNPRHPDFWDLFWRIYTKRVEAI